MKWFLLMVTPILLGISGICLYDAIIGKTAPTGQAISLGLTSLFVLGAMWVAARELLFKWR